MECPPVIDCQNNLKSSNFTRLLRRSSEFRIKYRWKLSSTTRRLYRLWRTIGFKLRTIFCGNVISLRLEELLHESFSLGTLICPSSFKEAFHKQLQILFGNRWMVKSALQLLLDCDSSLDWQKNWIAKRSAVAYSHSRSGKGIHVRLANDLYKFFIEMSSDPTKLFANLESLLSDNGADTIRAEFTFRDLINNRFAEASMECFTPAWYHVRCMDHWFQLVANKVHGHILDEITLLRSFISNVRKSKVLTVKYKSTSLKQKSKAFISPRTDSPTHWWSTQDMLVSCIVVKEDIKSMYEKTIKSTKWTKKKLIWNFLASFKQTTLDGTILLYLRLGDLRVHVWFEAVPDLALNLLLGTLLIDRFVRGIIPAEQKLVSWQSHPVAILSLSDHPPRGRRTILSLPLAIHPRTEPSWTTTLHTSSGWHARR